MTAVSSVVKVTVFGSESTGKTTLAAQLAAYFQTVWVPEYARLYQETHKRILTYRDVTPIARGQMRLEKYYVSKAQNLLICDTDILETKVYSIAYYGRSPEWLLQALPNHYADLYLLTDIDLPWTSDGIRDRPDDRQAMHHHFHTELVNRNLPFALISGHEQDRLQTAIKAIRYGLRAGAVVHRPVSL